MFVEYICLKSVVVCGVKGHVRVGYLFIEVSVDEEDMQTEWGEACAGNVCSLIQHFCFSNICELEAMKNLYSEIDEFHNLLLILLPVSPNTFSSL